MSENQKTKESKTAQAVDLQTHVIRCCKIIGCDVGRITTPTGKMYFIAGYNRNTKDDSGQFYKDGKLYDFDYVHEQVVASGMTEDELIKSCEEYHRICGLTMEEYLKEKIEASV